jgi:hypothetical protein
MAHIVFSLIHQLQAVRTNELAIQTKIRNSKTILTITDMINYTKHFFSGKLTSQMDYANLKDIA